MADRQPLTLSAIRAIAIRRSIARRAASNDNGNTPTTPAPSACAMPKALLAACVAAGGFDAHAAAA